MNIYHVFTGEKRCFMAGGEGVAGMQYIITAPLGRNGVL